RYVLDIMTRIKRAGRFDDRGSWMIASVVPVLIVNCMCREVFATKQNGLSQPWFTTAYWNREMIVVHRLLDRCWDVCGIGCDQNWNNWKLVTRLMKIFQIKCVIPDLINCGARKRRATDFELQHEHGLLEQQDRIYSATQPRNVKFEE